MKAFLFLILFPFYSFHISELFFDFEYTTIDGEVKQFGEFEGRKIMVVALPVSQTENNSKDLKLLDSLSIKYSSEFIMVGVPSIEDGFSQDSADALKDWYRSELHEQFIVTSGMYTRKASPLQHPLFYWLTNKSGNMHFDEDMPGPGEMYFINEQGELYGVFSPAAILNEQLLNRMASTF